MKLIERNFARGMIVGIAFLVMLVLAYHYSGENKEIARIKVGNHDLYAEVAREEAAQARGLSRRPEICSACGMLFVFPEEDRYPFWMKGMQFDLDIIWIKGGKIAGIERRVSHEQNNLKVLRPEVKIDSVLEVKAGLSDEWGIKAGDEVRF